MGPVHDSSSRSDDENEEVFRRSRQRPACQPEFVPERLRRAAPQGREPGRPPVHVFPVKQDQIPFRGPWERVRARVRAQEGIWGDEAAHTHFDACSLLNDKT